VVARSDYDWTEDLNVNFRQHWENQPGMNGGEAVALIRRLTGLPWHVCRTQACLLGVVRPRVHHDWTTKLDEILTVGYEKGGRAKQKAIEGIGALTGWTRQVCWDRARKLGLAQTHPRRWTSEEDKYLLDFVNSKNLREIAKRLKRSPPAVRKRLAQLAVERKFSARVSDGHTKSELAEYLGRSKRTIQRWIDERLLKARYEGKNRADDTLRITDEDFRAFWKKHPWEVPLHRLSHDGLLWFCSIMFDVPPNDYFGDPLDRHLRRLEHKQQACEAEKQVEIEEG
jgi:hypothetical protein